MIINLWNVYDVVILDFFMIFCLNFKMYLWLKLYTVPFFVSWQTYKISKGSKNNCSHCMYLTQVYSVVLITVCALPPNPPEPWDADPEDQAVGHQCPHHLPPVRGVSDRRHHGHRVPAHMWVPPRPQLTTSCFISVFFSPTLQHTPSVQHGSSTLGLDSKPSPGFLFSRVISATVVFTPDPQVKGGWKTVSSQPSRTESWWSLLYMVSAGWQTCAHDLSSWVVV